MNPLNPIFALLTYLVAFATTYVINLKYKIKTTNVRYESIDGMRGLLAIGVFICHSAIWYQYLHTGIWSYTKSIFYTQLGETSVALFFMITSFLFITKLLNDKKYNWNTFFISRFFRLVPIYLASVIVLVTIVFTISHWELKETYTKISQEIFYWGAFTIPGSPAINDSSYTNMINAGVTWSLHYEWFFYFSLPIIALLFKNRPSTIYLIISFIFVIYFYRFKGINPYHLLSFAGGTLSPFLIKYKSRNINYNSKIFSIIILCCLILVFFFKTNHLYDILIIIIFNLIAMGNNLFGLLKSSILKLLGEISFSTYLLHGMIIFIPMYFFYGIEESRNISVVDFWQIILALTPVVVFISFLSYIYIEKPCMDYYKNMVLKKKPSIDHLSKAINQK